MIWKGDLIAAYETDRHQYYLFDGSEHCGTAFAEWVRGEHADFDVWFMEGAFRVHVDLKAVTMPAVAWRVGEQVSVVGFTRTQQNSFNANGVITTASGRTLALAPTGTNFITAFGGYEHAIQHEDGARFITISGSTRLHVGGNPGHMLIAPQEASDPELPALVAMAFAIANVEINRLYEMVAPSVIRI